jgi:hypothetical protein
MVPYQNAYGAKWDCVEATWIMPDGSTILAEETIRNMTSQGQRRGFAVYFGPAKSKMQPTPNPYLKK